MSTHQVEQHNIARAFVSLDAVRNYQTLNEIDVYCIDAPAHMPAGSTIRMESEGGPLSYGPTIWRR